jgi:hypothetical protein
VLFFNGTDWKTEQTTSGDSAGSMGSGEGCWVVSGGRVSPCMRLPFVPGVCHYSPPFLDNPHFEYFVKSVNHEPKVEMFDEIIEMGRKNDFFALHNGYRTSTDESTRSMCDMHLVILTLHPGLHATTECASFHYKTAHSLVAMKPSFHHFQPK